MYVVYGMQRKSLIYLRSMLLQHIESTTIVSRISNYSVFPYRGTSSENPNPVEITIFICTRGFLFSSSILQSLESTRRMLALCEEVSSCFMNIYQPSLFWKQSIAYRFATTPQFSLSYSCFRRKPTTTNSHSLLKTKTSIHSPFMLKASGKNSTTSSRKKTPHFVSLVLSIIFVFYS